jgi:DNA-binding IclR family transcriptional regulator
VVLARETARLAAFIGAVARAIKAAMDPDSIRARLSHSECCDPTATELLLPDDLRGRRL